MVRSIQGKHPEYYEAVLQLRNITSTILDFVYREIDRGRVHLAKEVELKNGRDIYLSDNDFTRSLGKKLQETFGGEYNLTASLFGRKSGKEIHRLTVLFRGILFTKGDLVEYQGDQYKVKILGKDILLQEVKTGKKVHVKYGEMNQIKIIKKLQAINIPFIVLSINPYDLQVFPEVSTFLTIYDYSPFNLQVASEVIVGKHKAQGILPIILKY